MTKDAKGNRPGSFSYEPTSSATCKRTLQGCKWGIAGEDTGGFAYWCESCGAYCDSGGKLYFPLGVSLV